MIFLFTVPILSPSGAPLNFTVSISGPRTLTFSWKPPSEDQQNGPIIRYCLQCIAIHDRDHRVEMNMDYLQMSFSVSEFLPDTSYNCSVSALTAAGRGPIASQTISTLEDGNSEHYYYYYYTSYSR